MSCNSNARFLICSSCLSAAGFAFSNKLSKNDSIYSGLFYTGSEALSLGLIDGLSSLYDLKSDRYDNLPIQKYNRDNDILNQILKTSFHYLSQSNLN